MGFFKPRTFGDESVCTVHRTRRICLAYLQAGEFLFVVDQCQQCHQCLTVGNQFPDGSAVYQGLLVFQQSQLGFIALRGINLFHQSGGLLILGRDFSDNVHQRIKRVHACCLPFVHAGGEIETFFAVDGNFFGFGHNILTVDFCQQVD